MTTHYIQEKKEPYTKPTTKVICTHCEYGMLKTLSLGVNQNKEADFEAGAKKHIFEEDGISNDFNFE